MKVEIVKEPVQRGLDFPLIAECSDGGHLVLFTGKRAGTVLTKLPGSVWDIGYYSNTWVDVTDKSYWTIVDSVTLRFKS